MWQSECALCLCCWFHLCQHFNFARYKSRDMCKFLSIHVFNSQPFSYYEPPRTCTSNGVKLLHVRQQIKLPDMQATFLMGAKNACMYVQGFSTHLKPRGGGTRYCTAYHYHHFIARCWWLSMPTISHLTDRPLLKRENQTSANRYHHPKICQRLNTLIRKKKKPLNNCHRSRRIDLCHICIFLKEKFWISVATRVQVLSCTPLCPSLRGESLTFNSEWLGISSQGFRNSCLVCTENPLCRPRPKPIEV